MPDFYSEPFLNLAGLTHNSALITWGAFYFRVKNSGEEFKLVDDDDLKKVVPPREDSIGAKSRSYGDAKVEVKDMAGNVVATASTSDRNHCWMTGLTPDTEYTYRVIMIKTEGEEEWAQGPRRNWEKRADGKMGLGPKMKSYNNRFRTHPDPTKPADAPFTFAVIGDFGVGVKKEKEDRRQRQIAEALEKAVDEHNVRLILTTGDNVYRSGGLFGIIGGETGDEDDDWYFTYYQPYRYVINRVPTYPTIGNHDADETEARDDRTQLEDNLYIHERIAGKELTAPASTATGLFYRLRYNSEVEFICIDTSKEPTISNDRLYQLPKPQEFLKTALPKSDGNGSPIWRIPFCHHPPFSAGPEHHNTKGMENLIKQFKEAGVRLVLSGHEHNFQHSKKDGVDYIVSGGAGKIRSSTPKKDDFAKAFTASWAATYHFLLITIDGKEMTIRPIGELSGGQLADIPRLAPDKTVVTDPITIKLA